ncbi:hypothetical protein [Paraburkholderia sp. BR10882]|uniref:hypothetical protein n=1 Tax=Paraburkholderia sp. BR10882 TaxID=3236991 RepID=UPI0034CF198B
MEQNAHGARRLPILGITANTAPENLSQCSEAGMDDCLVKPTRVATLREHLARWFGVEGIQRTVQDEVVREAGANGQGAGKQRRGLPGRLHRDATESSRKSLQTRGRSSRWISRI